jgi:hypothetical protein
MPAAEDRPPARDGSLNQRKGKNVPSSQQLRQQEQHEQKLRDMRDQVAAGKLVIRQMTPEERKRFPPRDAPEPSGRSKRR